MRPWPRVWNGGPAEPRGEPALVVEIAVRTVSETNTRGDWRKLERKKEQRDATEFALTFDDDRVARLAASGPWCVRLTRISPKRLDRGNVPPALKAIEDAVAAALEVDDGDDAFGITWAQEQRKGEPAVRVEIWGGGSAPEEAA